MSAVNKLLRSWGDPVCLPVNGKAGIQLLDLVERIVCQQPQVRTICELGCGGGSLVSRLAARSFSVTGVDASDVLLASAAKHHASDKVTLVRGVIGELPPISLAGTFDLVVSSDVIEHLLQPALLIRDAHRLLRPGGRLVVGTPYHGYFKNVAISLLGKWDSHHHVHFDGGHIKYFSVRTLSAMLMLEGFEVERMHYFGRAPGLWKNMIAVAKKRE
jgi:2-polyprenyl-3-methyl-5-hydroxy-6-metoxy-1,4-benzoquinol methylase